LPERETEDAFEDRGLSAGTDAAEDLLIRHLIEVLRRLQDDLDRVELWTAALSCFLGPVPDYQPGDQFMLPPHSRSSSPRGRAQT